MGLLKLIIGNLGDIQPSSYLRVKCLYPFIASSFVLGENRFPEHKRNEYYILLNKVTSLFIVLDRRGMQQHPIDFTSKPLTTTSSRFHGLFHNQRSNRINRINQLIEFD